MHRMGRKMKKRIYKLIALFSCATFFCVSISACRTQLAVGNNYDNQSGVSSDGSGQTSQGSDSDSSDIAGSDESQTDSDQIPDDADSDDSQTDSDQTPDDDVSDDSQTDSDQFPEDDDSDDSQTGADQTPDDGGSDSSQTDSDQTPDDDDSDDSQTGADQTPDDDGSDGSQTDADQTPDDDDSDDSQTDNDQFPEDDGSDGSQTDDNPSSDGSPEEEQPSESPSMFIEYDFSSCTQLSVEAQTSLAEGIIVSGSSLEICDYPNSAYSKYAQLDTHTSIVINARASCTLTLVVVNLGVFDKILKLGSYEYTITNPENISDSRYEYVELTVQLSMGQYVLSAPEGNIGLLYLSIAYQ